MKKTTIFIIVLSLALIFTIAGKIISKNSETKATSAAPVFTVSSELAQSGKIDGFISYTGTVEGLNEATIVCKTGGIVEKVNFQVGQKVSAGQILIVIDNDLQKAGVGQAKSAVMAAEAAYEKAQADLKRIETLQKQEVATKDNLELSQLNVKACLAQLTGAQANLKVAERNYDDCFVKATISGNIATKDIVIGATAAPGMKVTHLVDFSKFKIMINVNENDISKLTVGKKVAIKVDAIPGNTFEGIVNTIGMYSGDGMRAYPVEVIINNNKYPLKSGMFARCEIMSESKDNALLVSETSVVLNNDGTAHLFVIENGKSFLKKVKLGIKSNGKYEILSGIEPNSKVVTLGKERLVNDMIVKEK